MGFWRLGGWEDGFCGEVCVCYIGLLFYFSWTSRIVKWGTWRRADEERICRLHELVVFFFFFILKNYELPSHSPRAPWIMGARIQHYCTRTAGTKSASCMISRGVSAALPEDNRPEALCSGDKVDQAATGSLCSLLWVPVEVPADGYPPQ